MTTTSIIFGFFLIFFGAAILSTFALFTRQSLLVAYIVLGALIGPWGFKLIDQIDFIHELSSVGIVFLLFLLGLELQLGKLYNLLRGAALVTIISSIIFSVVFFLASMAFGFPLIDSFIIGITMIFSSTIISIKLLPANRLNHQSIGKKMVSVLLLQDFIAIFVLLGLKLWGSGAGSVALANGFSWFLALRVILSVPILILFAVFFEKWILIKLLNRFSFIKEYVFLLALGWCLGMSELAYYMGVSHEIGAFIAGVTLTISPVSHFIAERLKPLRDFFLIVFFFSVGASINFMLLLTIIVPVLVMALMVIIIKPLVYKSLMPSLDGSRVDSWEFGLRLGQASEFSLLVVFMGFHNMLISQEAYLLVQAVTVLSFIASSYIIGFKFPGHLSVSLNKDFNKDFNKDYRGLDE